MKTLFTKTTDTKNVYFLKLQTHVRNKKKIVKFGDVFGCIKM